VHGTSRARIRVIASIEARCSCSQDLDSQSHSSAVGCDMYRLSRARSLWSFVQAHDSVMQSVVITSSHTVGRALVSATEQDMFRALALPIASICNSLAKTVFALLRSATHARYVSHKKRPKSCQARRYVSHRSARTNTQGRAGAGGGICRQASLLRVPLLDKYHSGNRSAASRATWNNAIPRSLYWKHD
jgi:hypothetical protein